MMIDRAESFMIPIKFLNPSWKAFVSVRIAPVPCVSILLLAGGIIFSLFIYPVRHVRIAGKWVINGMIPRTGGALTTYSYRIEPTTRIYKENDF